MNRLPILKMFPFRSCNVSRSSMLDLLIHPLHVPTRGKLSATRNRCMIEVERHLSIQWFNSHKTVQEL